MPHAGRLPSSEALERRCSSWYGVAPFSDPSATELECCLAVAAYLVIRHGDAYIPTFERLEYEVEQMRRKLGNRERAQRVLATLNLNGSDSWSREVGSQGLDGAAITFARAG